MAETKKAKASNPKKAKSKPRAKASKRPSGSAAAATKRRKAPARSTNGSGVAESVKDTVVNGAHDAANGIASGAQKAKLPLVATGAVLVGGAAGAIAAKSGGGKRKVRKVQMPSGKRVKRTVRKAAGAVGDAARRADVVGQRISRLASSVQKVSETTDDTAKKF